MQLARAKTFFRLQQPRQVISKPLTGNKSRVESIDLLRGLVMIIMALDHVRDYFHADAMIFDPTDLSQTSPVLFFTRFITHYCAPVFMLLSGTSAYLVGMRKGKKAVSRFLFTRGLWLIALEFTVINFAWYFNVHFSSLDFLVIWALGFSMVCLSALVYLPLPAIAAVSLVMIFGHNLLDNVHVTGNGMDAFGWSLLHEMRPFFFDSFTSFVAYPVIPWIGVMAIGYCMGIFYQNYPAAQRQAMLLRIGIAAVVLFILLRAGNWYGDPSPWSSQSSASFTILSFLNVSKYPPSLLYLLVTLGPALIFLSFTEQSRSWLSEKIKVVGRVPMFFYIIHLYLIHLGAMLAAELTGFGWSSMILDQWIGMEPGLKGYGFSLAFTYGAWIALTLVLYFMCRWYDRYKRTHQHWWLSYI